MTTVKAHFDGKVFVPHEPVKIEPGVEVELHLDVPAPSAGTPPPPAPSRKGGWLEGQAWIAPDFDAPLEDFKEYME